MFDARISFAVTHFDSITFFIIQQFTSKSLAKRSFAMFIINKTNFYILLLISYIFTYHYITIGKIFTIIKTIYLRNLIKDNIWNNDQKKQPNYKQNG